MSKGILDMLKHILILLETPKFPHLISLETAKYLAQDFCDRNAFRLQVGNYVRNGHKSVCFSVCFSVGINDIGGETAEVCVMTMLRNIARWAGQEFMRIVRDPMPYEPVPLGAESYAADIVGGEPNLYATRVSVQSKTYAGMTGATQAFVRVPSIHLLDDGSAPEHVSLGGQTFLFVGKE